MKKICLLILLLSILYLHCDDLDRNNILDPKNPNSFLDRTILAEIFINDSTGYEFTEYALTALNNISQKDEYKEKIFIIEYHLANDGWNDLFANFEFNQRYYEYVPNSSDRWLPDVMFNGLLDRVQGASVESIESRYLSSINKLTGDKSYFGFETEAQISGNNINLDVSVIRYGSDSKSDCTLNVVIYEDIGTNNHRHVVRKILQRQTINNIKPGESKSFSFYEQIPEVQNINNLHFLIFIQDTKKSNKEVYQVIKI